MRRLLTAEHGVIWMLCLFVLFVILAFVVNHPAMSRFDQRVTAKIQRNHRPWLDGLARGGTFLANTEIIIGIGILVCGYLMVTKHPWAALFSAAGLLGMPISGTLKQVIGRQRPKSEIARVVLPAVGLSFPSGHAMTALMFYGFIALLIGVHVTSGIDKVLIGLLVLLIVLISWSRIYLGAHWFSDILGGWAGGTLLLFVMSILYRKLGAGDILVR